MCMGAERGLTIMASQRVIISGGGIGGLAAALALAHVGVPSLVIERDNSFSEFGAGLQISPNASRILQAWGVEPYLKDNIGIPDEVRISCAHKGQKITYMPLGTSAVQRWGAPYWTIHRADLHTALLHACQTQPLIDIQTGCALQQITDLPDGVQIHARQGQQDLILDGMALIGCDGVRSTTRALWLRDGAPTFTGYSALRATLPMEEVPAHFQGNYTGLWLGTNVHLVHYALRRASLLNLVLIIKDEQPQEGWALPTDRSFAANKTNHLHPSLRQLIAQPETWTRWGMFGRHSDKAWPQGHISLLGDAAHPMLPFLAQGAGMAIEDAAILAALITQNRTDIPKALAQYQALRLPRTGRVQQTALRNGKIFHLPAPLSFARNISLRALQGAPMARRLDWLYGYHAPMK